MKTTLLFDPKINDFGYASIKIGDIYYTLMDRNGKKLVNVPVKGDTIEGEDHINDKGYHSLWLNIENPKKTAGISPDILPELQKQTEILEKVLTAFRETYKLIKEYDTKVVKTSAEPNESPFK